MADLQSAPATTVEPDTQEKRTLDDEINALRTALASARADADARAEQLAAAKEKAKAIIRAQQERSA
eukprot:IDg18488t1